MQRWERPKAGWISWKTSISKFAGEPVRPSWISSKTHCSGYPAPELHLQNNGLGCSSKNCPCIFSSKFFVLMMMHSTYSTRSCPPRLMFSVLLGWCTQTLVFINVFFLELSRYRTWGPPHQNDCAPDHHYQLSVEAIKFSPTHWSSLAFSREGFHRYLGLAQCAFWQQLYFQTRYLSNIIQLWIHACA